MQKDLERTPNLRFNEFSENWVLKKLGKVFSIFNGYAFASKDSLKTDGILWVKIADVGVDKMKRENLSFLPSKFKEKHKRFLLKENEYVIALTRPILRGKLKIARIDSFFNDSLLNQRVGKMISENNHAFVFNLLKRKRLIKSIENNIAGSDPPNLSPKEINSIKIHIPSLDEQQKIATFLSFVDKKIAQLEQKKTLLEQYKKGIRQKVFSYNSRFNEFKKLDLRKGRLKDFGYFYYGKSAPKSSVTFDAETPCVRYGELYSTYGDEIKEIKSYTNINPKTLKFSKGGEVLVPRVGEDPLDFANCSYLPIPNVAIGEMISVYNTNENGLFMTYYINAMLKKELAKRVEGGNVSNLYFRYVEEIEIVIPSIEEQTKIANFLSAIDAKITQVNTQLENTQQFKKGLLQQMFV